MDRCCYLVLIDSETRTLTLLVVRYQSFEWISRSLFSINASFLICEKRILILLIATPPSGYLSAIGSTTCWPASRRARPGIPEAEERMPGIPGHMPFFEDGELFLVGHAVRPAGAPRHGDSTPWRAPQPGLP